MAHTKSTQKRIKQSEKKRIQNSMVKSSIRTSVKKVLKTIKSGAENIQNIEESLKDFVKSVDTAARKGILHKKTAARKKSRLAKQINKLKKTAPQT